MRQEGEEFKIILGYITKLRSAYTIGDLVSKNQTKIDKIGGPGAIQGASRQFLAVIFNHILHLRFALLILVHPSS